jgi:hypothetical protein
MRELAVILVCVMVLCVLAFGVWGMKRVDASARQSDGAALDDLHRQLQDRLEERSREAAQWQDDLLAELRRQSAALERQNELLEQLARRFPEQDAES